MIEEVQPLVLALQETMFNEEGNFRILRYNAITKTGHFNWRSHGGTMLLIHESIPMTEIQLQTEAQAAAANKYQRLYHNRISVLFTSTQLYI